MHAENLKFSGLSLFFYFHSLTIYIFWICLFCIHVLCFYYYYFILVFIILFILNYKNNNYYYYIISFTHSLSLSLYFILFISSKLYMCSCILNPKAQFNFSSLSLSLFLHTYIFINSFNHSFVCFFWFAHFFCYFSILFFVFFIKKK